MITVYYRQVFFDLKRDAFSCYLSRVEAQRRERILRIQNEKERLRSLSAGILLYETLCERVGAVPGTAAPFSIEYGEKGKPYLADHPKLHFNLSHSGAYVALVLGDSPMGVDLQEKTRVRKGIAERFFSGYDNQRLSDCESEEEKRELFFRMWSIKEGYLKLTGSGIGGGLSDFEISWEENAIYDRRSETEQGNWQQKGQRGDSQGQHMPAAYFEETRALEGYSFCVCFREWGQKVIWKEFPCRNE